TEHFHWYLSIIPRVSKVAGFELGSGIFINASSPEEGAEFLRGITLPDK
ncbi:MAG: galactose-1-phosphate uridylyltransferase, partial [Candidatus Omnitrophica bacterium]|nr:galactose-1-phosphate uridylyltransferase [Candidatus Omnitrophota bacterium]